MALVAGAARRDMTFVAPELPMFGWGIVDNTTRGVGLRLYARALVLGDANGTQRVALVLLDHSHTSPALREEVVRILREEHPDCGVDEESLLLAATHTHSAPGGFSHHLYYNLRTPGWHPPLLAFLARVTVQTIVAAAEAAQPAEWSWARGRFDRSAPVSFNRSVRAYNRNPEVQPVSWSERYQAVDREMPALWVRTPEGAPIACVNWFACHCTSVHADNHHLHGDNKGVAALHMERTVRAEGAANDFVALFMPGASGDLSPNGRWCRRRKKMVGLHDDDFASARAHGELQSRVALRTSSAAVNDDGGALDAALLYLDFRGFRVPARYGLGEARETCSAIVGVPFLEGTQEGPGPLLPLRGFMRQLSRIAWDVAGVMRPSHGAGHGGKLPFLETGEPGGGKSFHFFTARRPPLPSGVDEIIRAVRRYESTGSIGPGPWTPNVVPVQVIRLGPVAVAALPTEPTLTAGRRVARSVLEALADEGVEAVIPMGYANSYAGYVVTPEEYVEQAYEGGSTYFGQWTLGAYQARLDEVCARLRTPRGARDPSLGPAPYRFRFDELDGQQWVPPGAP